MSDRDQTVSAKYNTEIKNKINSPATHIELFYRGKEMSYRKTDLPKLIGRDERACDIIVNTDVASRKHCAIVVQANQIGVLDRSTNGTFLRVGRAEPFVIKNRFYPLVGQGHIKLGGQFDVDDKDIIYFRMLSKSDEE
ncbi:hypothetical protein TDB9533_01890 [Thalassocella blandensis]|nr:hypothetical protein TDB9533_01890 [Thalassocella blandensis]